MSEAENTQVAEEIGALGTLDKLEAFVEKNKKVVYAVATLIVLGAVGYFFLRSGQEEEELIAQKEIFTAQYLFAQDSLDIVLNGDGNVVGVEEIAESYPSTKAGNLAKFYSGVIYLKKGDFETAISYLEDFNTSDYLVQARAYSLIGDANMELEEYEEAVSYYEKAAGKYPNEFFTPKYLTKLALAHEKLGDIESALEAYNKILSSFPNSSEANRAKKYTALLANSI